MALVFFASQADSAHARHTRWDFAFEIMRLENSASNSPNIPALRQTIFAVSALIIVIFLIYGNAFDCSWHLDDKPNITDNPRIHLSGLHWQGIKAALYSDQRNPGVLYRPVAALSFALNYYFGGLDVAGYHLVNIIIHVIASIFLFLFIHNTMHLPSLRGRYGSKGYFIALLSTFLWAIHPIQTQGVTYIVQRMASLAGMFYIMAMYFYLRARTASGKMQRIAFGALCISAFLLALGSKENAILLPLSLLLFEILLFQDTRSRALSGNLKTISLLVGITVLVGGGYLFYREEGLLSFFSGYQDRPFTLYQRLLTEPRVLLFYVSQLLYPSPERFSVAHSMEISTSLFHPVTTLPSILVIIGSIAFLVLRAKRMPLISFSFLFFLVNHAVESTILPLELVFEHRNYIPSMMFFIPFAMALALALERYEDKKAMKGVFVIFIILVLVGFGSGTYIRNFTWKDPGSLWTDASFKAPDHWRVHHNLGVYFYEERGDIERARVEFERALKSPVVHRRNEKMLTYYQLGKLYGDLRNLKPSEFYYRKALDMDPGFYHALNSLAGLYDLRGESEKADKYLMSAYSANPADPSVNFNMGVYFLKENKSNKAIYHLTRALGEERLAARTLLYLGVAYKRKGWYGRAAVTFRKSLEVNKKDITPHLHLMEIYSIKGHHRLSRREAARLVRLLQREESLFNQVMNLLLNDGFRGHVRLSAQVILPLLYQALEQEGEGLDRKMDIIQKILENESKIS
ncbi:MAG: hypothetical protein JRJ03_07345 [Deltaproteobacteria bacterium]|nr:hypothetical protein [Deltaproteobacteria bacterium]